MNREFWRNSITEKQNSKTKKANKNNKTNLRLEKDSNPQNFVKHPPKNMILVT